MNTNLIEKASKIQILKLQGRQGISRNITFKTLNNQRTHQHKANLYRRDQPTKIVNVHFISSQFTSDNSTPQLAYK